MSPHIRADRWCTLEVIAKDFQLDTDDLLALHDAGLVFLEYQLGSSTLLTARPAEVASLLQLELHDIEWHLLTPQARRERLATDDAGTCDDESTVEPK